MNEFKPVQFVDVALEGQFWRERLETVLTRTIPSQHVQLGKHGILQSLTLPNPPPLRSPRNQHNFVQVFWDSDAGKWIEAASYALSHRPDADIEARIEKVRNPDKMQSRKISDSIFTRLEDGPAIRALVYEFHDLIETGPAYSGAWRFTGQEPPT